MSTTRHPHAQLSAYLDGALASVDRAAVEGHLNTCAECRARLGDLRATASLIRGLPDLVPSRRLVPRIAGVPVWLAPLRTLSTLASGVSVFLFIASALLGNIGTLALPTSLSAPAAAPAAGGAGAPNATAAAERQDATRGLAPTAPGPITADAASAAPKASEQFSAAAASPQPPAQAASDTSSESANARSASRTTALGPSPWLWLALAIVMGAIALALQRRLRSA